MPSITRHIQYIYTKLRDLAREAIFAGWLESHIGKWNKIWCFPFFFGSGKDAIICVVLIAFVEDNISNLV
jgi:hypothetical protein